jgi:hypothetical protein
LTDPFNYVDGVPDPLNYVDDGFTDILYGGLGNDTYYVSHEDLIFDMTLEQAGVPISDGQGGLTLRSMTSSAPAPVAQPAPLGKTETQSLAQVG